MSDWTTEAQQRWDQIPADIQQRILEHVWCPECSCARHVALEGATIIAGDLVLVGSCLACDHRTARLVETELFPLETQEAPLFQPGDHVIWWKRLPGGVYVVPLAAKIVAMTTKRVKIIADDDGQLVTRFVPKESLQRRQ